VKLWSVQPVGKIGHAVPQSAKGIYKCELELLSHLWLTVPLLASSQKLKVMNTKILYLELNCFLTGIFARIGKRP